MNLQSSYGSAACCQCDRGTAPLGLQQREILWLSLRDFCSAEAVVTCEQLLQGDACWAIAGVQCHDGMMMRIAIATGMIAMPIMSL